MKLIDVHIQNFRSVEDSGKFKVDHLTCLVGKNEAGKTAILQAIAGLNSDPATPFEYDVERDYPKRYLARYKERHPEQDAIVIETTWELSDLQLDALAEEFGKDSITSSTVKIWRRYNSTRPSWTVPLDEAKALEFIIGKYKLSAPERSQIGKVTTTADLIEKLKPLADANSKHKSILDNITGYPKQNIFTRFRDVCEFAFPRFMYFSNYDRMSAAVHLPTLQAQAGDDSLFTKENLRSDRLFWEFLEFSGVSLDEILGATTFESFNARLRAASNTLTDEILEYWTQNQDLEIFINVAEGKPEDPSPFNKGAVGRARINNMLHKSDTSFSERSAGFTWFFSFLVKFDRVKKTSQTPTFLLLDEPGLTLHGMAQADLLRYFDEKLSPHHQLIYSTHSPFMVPPHNLMSARIVEDLVQVDQRGRRTPTGTRVREDILKTDRDSVFPLQGALGYSLTQSLFVGKHTILVEGPSDILYLQALSAELLKRKRESLDPGWVICPSGGLDKIQAFVSLFAGNELDVIALCDSSKKDYKKLENIRRSEILKKGGLLTFAEFVNQDEADVEDLFDARLFCDLVNNAYELPVENRLDPEKLATADPNTDRQVKKAEGYFNTLPETIPLFDHFMPASWLIANPSTLSGESEGVEIVLDRAEKLFNVVNSLKQK